MIINDITLDYISYDDLVIAVGLTVDYAVHVTHAIQHSHTTLMLSNKSLSYGYRNVITGTMAYFPKWVLVLQKGL